MTTQDHHTWVHRGHYRCTLTSGHELKVENLRTHEEATVSFGRGLHQVHSKGLALHQRYGPDHFFLDTGRLCIFIELDGPGGFTEVVSTYPKAGWRGLFGKVDEATILYHPDEGFTCKWNSDDSDDTYAR